MVSSASTRQLRIKDEDLLTVDDLIMGDYVGKWIRSRAYDKSHRLAPDRATAYCGRLLAIPEDWWNEEFRPWLDRRYGTDPGELFLAIERRTESNHCSPCKPTNAGPDSRWVEDTTADEVFVEQSLSATFIPGSPAERAAHTKFMSKVSWVARELGAEIV